MRKINDGLTNDQRYYKKNKEKLILKVKIWKKNHPEAVKKSNQKSFAQYYLEHRDKMIEKSRRNQRNHPEKLREINNRCTAKLRNTVLDKFGRKCNNSSCPIPSEKLDARSLQLDHINNNGAEERRLGLKTPQIYRRALKNSNEYQLLCAYCNWIG